MNDLDAIVLADDREPLVSAIADSLRAELAAIGDGGIDDDPGSSIALPVPEPRSIRLADARVAIALDAGALERAQRAGIERRVVIAPTFETAWIDIDAADLVLVPHPVLARELVGRGAPSSRVRAIGPIAPVGYEPATDRAALRAQLAIAGASLDARWVVVAAESIASDPAATLVQLALVRAHVVWLFDVGDDPELAAALRKAAPAYGLDAWIFARRSAEAASCYRAADAVLGAIEGPEAIAALAVGAPLIGLVPGGEHLRIANALETSGAAWVADAASTLAVTVDAALDAGARVPVENGAAAAVARIRDLIEGRLSREFAAGLPHGIERIGSIEARPADSAPPPKRASREDLDKSVDEELAALRAKLGLNR